LDCEVARLALMPKCARHYCSPALGSGPNESGLSHVECRALSPSHGFDFNLSIPAASPFEDRICLAVTLPIERSAQNLTNSRSSARCRVGYFSTWRDGRWALLDPACMAGGEGSACRSEFVSGIGAHESE